MLFFLSDFSFLRGVSRRQVLLLEVCGRREQRLLVWQVLERPHTELETEPLGMLPTTVERQRGTRTAEHRLERELLPVERRLELE